MTDFQKLLKIADIVDTIAPDSGLIRVEIKKSGEDTPDCIYIHITEAIRMTDVEKIGKEFGDCDPVVFTEQDDCLCISIANISHDDEFKINRYSMSIEFSLIEYKND